MGLMLFWTSDLHGAVNFKMSKDKSDSPSEPTAAGQSDGQLPQHVTDFVSIKLPHAKGRSTPKDHIADFEEVGRLITSEPPAWLASHLIRWSSSVLFGRAMEDHQPTRVEMRKILAEVGDAAGIVQRALGANVVREMLDAGGDGPISSPGVLRQFLDDIERRANRASTSPTLINREGKTKAGRGRALPDGAVTAQTFCALLIAETWKWFNGDYPPPRNRRAAEAVDLYWRLSGGEVLSVGEDRFATWRKFFMKIPTLKVEDDIKEYRRHLRQSEYLAAQLAAADGQ